MTGTEQAEALYMLRERRIALLQAENKGLNLVVEHSENERKDLESENKALKESMDELLDIVKENKVIRTKGNYLTIKRPQHIEKSIQKAQALKGKE